MDAAVASAIYRIRVEGIAALVVSVCFFLHSAKYLVRKGFHHPSCNHGRLYEDEDGRSSPEDMAKFSVKIPKIALAAILVMGCASSVAISVLDSLTNARDTLTLVNRLHVLLWVGFPHFPWASVG